MTLKQASSPPLLAVLLLLLYAAAPAAAAAAVFNITRLLGQYPEFAAFNGYLTKTNLSGVINNRRTITVLAFDDVAAAALAGKPLGVTKDVLSAHVILDYVDVQKLRRLLLRERSALLTTLFQASGRAADRQGFLNVSVSGDGDGVAFGSGVGGSPLVAKLLGSVAARPYDISVLQVSAPIFAPGVDPNPSPPPPPSPAAAPLSAEAPAPIDDVEDDFAPVAAIAPEADSPAPSDAPVSSPPEPEASDANAGEDAEAPALENSGSCRAKIGSLMIIIGLLPYLVSF